MQDIGYLCVLLRVKNTEKGQTKKECKKEGCKTIYCLIVYAECLSILTSNAPSVAAPFVFLKWTNLYP